MIAEHGIQLPYRSCVICLSVDWPRARWRRTVPACTCVCGAFFGTVDNPVRLSGREVAATRNKRPSRLAARMAPSRRSDGAKPIWETSPPYTQGTPGGPKNKARTSIKTSTPAHGTASALCPARWSELAESAARGRLTILSRLSISRGTFLPICGSGRRPGGNRDGGTRWDPS